MNNNIFKLSHSLEKVDKEKEELVKDLTYVLIIYMQKSKSNNWSFNEVASIISVSIYEVLKAHLKAIEASSPTIDMSELINIITIKLKEDFKEK